MFELTINSTVYSFNFGFGFYREIDKSVKSKADQNGVSSNVGLQYKLASVMDGNPDAILDVLDCANKYAKEPRITKKELEAYLEDPETDLDSLKEELLDFMRRNNTTKATMKMIDKLVGLSPEEKEALVKMSNQ